MVGGLGRAHLGAAHHHAVHAQGHLRAHAIGQRAAGAHGDLAGQVGLGPCHAHGAIAVHHAGAGQQVQAVEGGGAHAEVVGGAGCGGQLEGLARVDLRQEQVAVHTVGRAVVDVDHIDLGAGLERGHQEAVIGGVGGAHFLGAHQHAIDQHLHDGADVASQRAVGAHGEGVGEVGAGPAGLQVAGGIHRAGGGGLEHGGAGHQVGQVQRALHAVDGGGVVEGDGDLAAGLERRCGQAVVRGGGGAHLHAADGHAIDPQAHHRAGIAGQGAAGAHGQRAGDVGLRPGGAQGAAPDHAAHAGDHIAAVEGGGADTAVVGVATGVGQQEGVAGDEVSDKEVAVGTVDPAVVGEEDIHLAPGLHGEGGEGVVGEVGAAHLGGAHQHAIDQHLHDGADIAGQVALGAHGEGVGEVGLGPGALQREGGAGLHACIGGAQHGLAGDGVGQVQRAGIGVAHLH